MNVNSILGLASFGPTGTTEDDFRKEVSALYESRRSVIYRCALAYVRDPGEADDLTQEAFFRLYKHYREGKSVPHTVNWLTTVVRNLALNRIRHRRYEAPAITDEVGLALKEQVDPRANPEDSLLSATADQRVAAALTSLPQIERECLEMFARGLNMREIGESLKITEHQVLIKTKLGIRKLKRILSR